MRAFAILAVLVLTSCASKNTAKAPPPPPPPAKPVDLAGPPFTLAVITVKGKEIPLPEIRRPTIQFSEPNRASGLAGVNRYSAEVTRTSGEELSFGPAIATKMAGPPEAMALESSFLEALSTLTRVDFQGGRLKLASADGSTRLEFTR